MNNEIINYFNKTVELIKNKLNVDVNIYIEEYEDECLECGRCYKFNDGHYEISIDDFFVEQNYKFENGCDWALMLYHEETLLNCICHEIAHMKYWNHTKWHKKYTNELIELCS